MVKVESRRIIRAPVHKVFQLVSRLDAHPHVTGLWLTADLLDRRANTLTIHYRGYFAGMPVESVQRATLQPPQRIEFKQTRGALKMLRGQYLLKPVDGDTELSLDIEADVGIPFISETSAKLVLHSYVERSLEKFKLVAERDLPRVQRRPQESLPAAAELPPEPVVPEPPAPPQVQPQATKGAEVQSPATKGAEVQSPVRRRRRRRRRRRGKRPDGETPTA